MAHDILEALDIQHCLLGVGAEGVPQYMRRHSGQCLSIQLDILLLHSPHIVLQVHGYFGPTILVQKEESTISVYHHLNLRRSTVQKHSPN